MNRTIDADALTKRFVEFCNKNCPYTAKARNVMCGSCFMGLALEAVEDAPTIESQRWIPCSERLPEESGSYFVSGKWASGKVAVGDCEYSKDDGYFQTAWNFDVEAWMPLPEPYKEGE